MNCAANLVAADVRRQRVSEAAGSASSPRRLRAHRAFTLVEMLVVLGIIGILAAMTLPTFKSAGKGNVLETAMRQLQDDLALARLKAMTSRSKVYVVFAPDLAFFLGTNILSSATTNFLYTNAAANNLVGGQLSAYTVFAPRLAGDQPGQSTPRYLTEWHSLPDGTFIPPAVLRNPWIFHNGQPNFAGTTNRPPVTAGIPLEENTGSFLLTLPFIAFDEQGRAFGRTTNIFIPIVEGSIQHPKDSAGQANLPVNTDAIETAQLVATGGITPGIDYMVVGSVGSRIVYGGTNHYAGMAFTGSSADGTNYTISAGSPRLVQLYGVRIDAITGRSRAIRPEIR